MVHTTLLTEEKPTTSQLSLEIVEFLRLFTFPIQHFLMLELLIRCHLEHSILITFSSLENDFRM